MAKKPRSVENLTHDGDKRPNIPTAEYENLMRVEDKKPILLKYPRNTDLDPQLVWRGKDEQDCSDLIVTAPPLYIQEKINPKHIVDELMRESKERSDAKQQDDAPDLFPGMFEGGLSSEVKTEFYAHEQNWSNRMILGDSLQVMASLAEREGLRGKVQSIFIDPPYGIKFGSNWQFSTRSRNVKDSKENCTREREMVKAFRDTWSDGIHSYMTYLRDRITIARDLLHESGSIFVQIGEENVHRVRMLLEEVFGADNSMVTIFVQKKGSHASSYLAPINDYILWFTKSKREEGKVKFRNCYEDRPFNKEDRDGFKIFSLDGREVDIEEYGKTENKDSYEIIRGDPLTSEGPSKNSSLPFTFKGVTHKPSVGTHWKTTVLDPDGKTSGMDRLAMADRLIVSKKTFYYKRRFNDFRYKPISNLWTGLSGARNQVYVVQTNEEIVKRCLLMSTDPGDLVLDPTCGSGTTAVVAESWGRRWITIDTSRIALILAKRRLMSLKLQPFMLKDSEAGAKKLAKLTGKPNTNEVYNNNVKLGFVYKRAAHIKLSEIAKNTEIDEIYERSFHEIEAKLKLLNKSVNQKYEVWNVPALPEQNWSEASQKIFSEFWDLKRKYIDDIENSIQRVSDVDYLFDRPYEDSSIVRVTGPFTSESLSPHKTITVHDDKLDNTENTAPPPPPPPPPV